MHLALVTGLLLVATQVTATAQDQQQTSPAPIAGESAPQPAVVAPTGPAAASQTAPAVGAGDGNAIAPSAPPTVPAATAQPAPATSPALEQTPAPAADTSAVPPAGLASEPASSLAADPAASASEGDAKHLPHGLSPWGMFMAADIVVKAVMVGLAIASVMTWTVWIAKSFELSRTRSRLASGRRAISGVGSLAEAAQRIPRDSHLVAGLVDAAALELRLSHGIGDQGAIKERVRSRMDSIVRDTGRSLTYGTGILATIGSTAPFVGLFGTVWGIMNSFISISESQTTNLAIVAPGIAEALLATAIGLVAAIPAVVFYNQLARTISGCRADTAETAAEIERLVSRDLDRGLAITSMRAAE
ncbi:MAG: tonB-system energizer ExbB [Hyphomicrobiaceae bacterium]|nr:tonB-system energizer ExbB [Hyphomicrobiaceae bacterium]